MLAGGSALAHLNPKCKIRVYPVAIINQFTSFVTFYHDKATQSHNIRDNNIILN